MLFSCVRYWRVFWRSRATAWQQRTLRGQLENTEGVDSGTFASPAVAYGFEDRCEGGADRDEIDAEAQAWSSLRCVILAVVFGALKSSMWRCEGK